MGQPFSTANKVSTILSEERRPSSEQEQTWFQPPGIPVYGVTRGLPPPDMQTPWDFRPPAQQAPPPTNYAPPQQAPTPPPPSYAPQQAPPAYSAPAEPQPPPPQAPPPPPATGYAYPQPQVFGPAETPEDRSRELGIDMPDNRTQQ